MRKLLALLLAILMLATCLTACSSKDSDKKEKKESTSDTDKDNGKDKDNDEDKDENEYNDKNGTFLYDADEKTLKLGTPDKTLDPQEIYDNLTYTPEMFYGSYVLQGGEDGEEEFAEDAYYIEVPDFDYADDIDVLSELPIRFEAGNWNVADSVDGHHWASLTFIEATDYGYYYTQSRYCSYTVEGNVLSLRLLKEFDVDYDSKKITYALSDLVLEYEFSFCGRELTLSTDNGEVTLMAGWNQYDDNEYIYCSGNLKPGSSRLGKIDSIHFTYDSEDDYRSFYVYASDYDWCYNGIIHLGDNGLCTMTLQWEDGQPFTYQLVYFLCDMDGIILTDGVNTYYYVASWMERYGDQLDGYISDDQTGKLEDLTNEQIEQIVKTKEELMKELVDAFKAEGVSVTLNAETGEMSMDASILFGGDSAVLTEQGKNFLKGFVKVYTSVAGDEKYANFISHTMVEGHTAPVGNSSYEEGLPLSVERAEVVKEYCLSVSEGALQEDDLEAIGYSNSKPIMGADDKVDMAASRRVSFRFIIDLENFFN